MEQVTYPIPTENYYRTMLEILSFLKPFSELRSRQKDVYAELIKKYYKYKDLEASDRNKLIFNKDTYKEIATKLNISINNVNNIIGELREIKPQDGEPISLILGGESYGENSLEEKYIFKKVDVISFKIIENEKK